MSIQDSTHTYQRFCVILYDLYNLKNVKNTHAGVLSCRRNIPRWVFSTFLKLCKWYKIAQNCAKHLICVSTALYVRQQQQTANRKQYSETYSEPSQTSMMERFEKIVYGFQPLTIFTKHSKYASELKQQKSLKNTCYNSAAGIKIQKPLKRFKKFSKHCYFEMLNCEKG